MLTLVVVLMTATSFAQSKVGTIDPDFIISKMPELTEIQNALKEYGTDLENQLASKVTSYEANLKAAEAKAADMTPAERQAKQEELAGLENDIVKFRQNAAQLVQLKQGDLLKPLYAKVGTALEEIAKAQGYTQVLTIGNNNNLAYIDPAYDLTEIVMEKMGLKAK